MIRLLGTLRVKLDRALKVSTLQAIQEGLRRGGTFNFSDELAGAGRASGLPRHRHSLKTSNIGSLLANRLYGDVLRPAVGGARLLYENTLGTPGTASSEYETGRDEKRALLKAAQEQHPGALLGSEIVGSLAAPIPGLTATSLGAARCKGQGWEPALALSLGLEKAKI